MVSSAHPCLPGHFPGNAVVPGVVMLDHVAIGLLKQIEGYDLAGFPQVKFLRKLLPEVEVIVSYQAKNEMLYQFSCEANEQLILSGQIRLIMRE